MNTNDMTLAALAEVNPRVYAALSVLGPNGAGDPVIGLLGFMDRSDVVDLVRAADLAHRQADTEGWLEDGMTVDELAEHVIAYGSWRTTSPRWSAPLAAAFEAYHKGGTCHE